MRGSLQAAARSARFYFWPIILANVLAMTVGAGGDLRAMSWLALVISSMSSFGFLVNDLFDRRIDLVNRAGHYESADRATLIVGWVAAAGFCLIGLTVAFLLGSRAFTIAWVSGIGLAIYSPVIRKVVVLPNVTTAVFAAGPLWAPLVLSRSGGLNWQWWLVAAILCILTAREILMDVRDRDGDAAGHRWTLATWLGTKVSSRIGAAVSVAALAPFVAAIASRAGEITLPALATGLALFAVIGWLVVRFALVVAQSAGPYAAPVQTYVRSSRAAMILLPVLGWVLAS